MRAKNLLRKMRTCRETKAYRLALSRGKWFVEEEDGLAGLCAGDGGKDYDRGGGENWKFVCAVRFMVL